MRIIDRYLSILFLRSLALILAVLVGLYGLIEFLERADDFIEDGAAFTHYLRYPLYKLPLMATQTLPMALLLAAFATIGQLSRTQQVTALRSGGVSLWQTTRPLFVAGLLFSVIMLAANSWVIPWSTREANYILDTEIGKKDPAGDVTHDLYLRDSQRIVRVAHAYPRKGEIMGVMLLDFDPDFKLTRRLEADSASFEGGQTWRLRGVKERRFQAEGREVAGFSSRGEQLVDLGRGPAELSEIWAEPAELSFGELADIASRLQRDGQDPRRYLKELHLRAAQSLMPLIVILIGVPFALQRGRKATVGTGVALTLGVFVSYLLLQAIGMALGSAGLLPLPLAAWSANILLMLVGAWLFMTLDN
jgi:lipopolysaccharide export system permease protein